MKRSHEKSSEILATSYLWILPYFFSFLSIAVHAIDLENLLCACNVLFFLMVYLPVFMVVQLEFKGRYHNIRISLGNALVVCNLCDLFLHSGHFSV